MPSTTTVKTGLVRFAFLNLFEKKIFEGEKDGKYMATLLIPKTDKATLKAIEKAIELAKEAGKSNPKIKWGGVIPKKLELPVNDSEEHEGEYDGFDDTTYNLKAKSKYAPQVLGKDRIDLVDEDDIKSGDYGRAIIEFYAYNSNGNKGIAVALLAVQKIKDGEALGRTSIDAADAFDDDFADGFEDDDAETMF